MELSDTDFVDFSTKDTQDDGMLVSFAEPIVKGKKKQQKDKNIQLRDFLEENLQGVVKCPITCCTFFNPIIASDGFVYESSQMDKLLKGYHPKSPFTREKLSKEYKRIELINKLIDFGDKYGLEICGDKFIMSNSFEDSFDIICSAIENGSYDEVMKFDKFILAHVDFNNRTFCQVMLQAKFSNNEGYIKCIQYILEHSTDITFKWGSTNILHLFCRLCMFPSLIDYLIKYIKTTLKLNLSEFNVPDSTGRTPIYYLFERGYKELIECAFNSGINFTNEMLMLTSILIQTYKDEQSLFKMIDKLPDINQSYNGASLLFTAIRHQKINVVTYLLNKNADITIKNNNNLNAIHYAVQYGGAAIAKLLLDRCTNYEDEAFDGWRLIHMACYYSTRDVIEYLLDRDVRINTMISKFNGQDKQYLPINLLELNTRLKDGDFDHLMEFMIQLMEIQSI
ncbi:ankyrin repeat domain-containing protein [Fadolivirus algeromassiliense]|jgi:ankyrin repeat protein|uniref:Ankyrin repeat domain-containing protein n=1 Tax=Fadolivirus FV1/VV64 TaxID=3070911 RepID=A0A7D3QWH0_9VIRU|nr:ankyrin repeat domain-containing protein [Fadolivirus algeromassiliense]QKF93600.1 ankyrin repeat domain-containing protein [Fadolivirus FV1/VV64]